jgi:hypothetical protein
MRSQLWSCNGDPSLLTANLLDNFSSQNEETSPHAYLLLNFKFFFLLNIYFLTDGKDTENTRAWKRPSVLFLFCHYAIVLSFFVCESLTDVEGLHTVYMYTQTRRKMLPEKINDFWLHYEATRCVSTAIHNKSTHHSDLLSGLADSFA